MQWYLEIESIIAVEQTGLRRYQCTKDQTTNLVNIKRILGHEGDSCCLHRPTERLREGIADGLLVSFSLVESKASRDLRNLCVGDGLCGKNNCCDKGSHKEKFCHPPCLY